MNRCRHAIPAAQRLAWAALALAVLAVAAQAADERGEFLQRSVSAGDQWHRRLSGAARPWITRAEMEAQAHSRIERGTSCFQSGRCRLPNR